MYGKGDRARDSPAASLSESVVNAFCHMAGTGTEGSDDPMQVCSRNSYDNVFGGLLQAHSITFDLTGTSLHNAPLEGVYGSLLGPACSKSINSLVSRALVPVQIVAGCVRQMIRARIIPLGMV